MPFACCMLPFACFPFAFLPYSVAMVVVVIANSEEANAALCCCVCCCYCELRGGQSHTMLLCLLLLLRTQRRPTLHSVAVFVVVAVVVAVVAAAAAAAVVVVIVVAVAAANSEEAGAALCCCVHSVAVFVCCQCRNNREVSYAQSAEDPAASMSEQEPSRASDRTLGGNHSAPHAPHVHASQCAGFKQHLPTHPSARTSFKAQLLPHMTDG